MCKRYFLQLSYYVTGLTKSTESNSKYKNQRMPYFIVYLFTSLCVSYIKGSVAIKLHYSYI